MIAQGLKPTVVPPADSGNGQKVASETAAPVAVIKPTPEPLPSQSMSPESMREAVRAAAAQIDSFLKTARRDLEFRVDEQTHITVVTIRQAATGEIIRQIPNEEVLQLARHLGTGANVMLDLKV
jgi:flagellar protein FlaG